MIAKPTRTLTQHRQVWERNPSLLNAHAYIEALERERVEALRLLEDVTEDAFGVLKDEDLCARIAEMRRRMATLGARLEYRYGREVVERLVTGL